GALGNCWFAGALSVVAQMPDLISKICITKDVNPHGVYQLRLCHAGEWIDLVVDDYFPTSQVSEGFTDGQTIRFSRGGNLCYLGVRSHTVFCQVVTHVVLS
ncbi:CAPN15, partial [Symbiodinium microadriaticum]